MISITITTDAADTLGFLVSVAGKLEHPRALNADLADCLKDELLKHFDARNQEPDKRGWPKSNFWAKAARLTKVKEVTDTGATVQVGADAHVRIHVLGGTIKPTGGRKFLTIPLIKEAKGVKAADYEKYTKRKLFRLPGSKVLVERTEDGTQSTLRAEKPTLRTRAGYKVFNLGPGMRVRPVYALAEQAVIPKDPRALPPRAELASVLQEAANAWAQREMAKKKGPATL
jgi:hypothetical protein